MATTPTYAFRYRLLGDTPDIAAGTQNLAEDVEAKLIGVDRCVTINSIDGTGTTTSGSYVDVPAPSSLSFTKAFTATALLVWAKMEWYHTVNGTVAGMGVRINAVDYDLDRCNHFLANERFPMIGTNRVAVGLAAGVYTIQLRWARIAGTGVLTQDGGGRISMSVREVA